MASQVSRGSFTGSNHAVPGSVGSKSYQRPPVCFTCGKEGHYVVNCPRAAPSSSSGHTPVSMPRISPGCQSGVTPHYGTPVNQYSQSPDYGANGYGVTGHPNHEAYASGAGGPCTTSESQTQHYQQHSGYMQNGNIPMQTAPYAQDPAFASQAYAPSNAAYAGGPSPSQIYRFPNFQGQSQDYSHYSHAPLSQPSQSYDQNAYHNSSGYAHQSGSYQHHTDPYQGPRSYYDTSDGYAGPSVPLDHAPPQWNHGQTYSADLYQDPQQGAYNSEYDGQYNQSTTQPAYSQHQVQQSYSSESYDYNQQPHNTNFGYPPIHEGTQYGFQDSSGGHYAEPLTQVSSAASTPFGSPRQFHNDRQSLQAHGNPGSDGRLDDMPHDSELDLSSWDKAYFNWEYKKIFKEDVPTPLIAINRPLPAVFDDDTSSLFASASTDTISRYASKSYKKEFVQSIRSSHHWSSMLRDTAFLELPANLPSIPLSDLENLRAERIRDTRLNNVKLESGDLSFSRKRSRSDEWLDNQTALSQDRIAEDGTQLGTKRQKSGVAPPITTVFDDRASILKSCPGTPVLGAQSSTTSLEDNDVWAPQAGEGICTNPVEAKVASTEVLSAPKPVESQDTKCLSVDSIQSGKCYSSSPQRQDSGYISARGSLSNGEVDNMHGYKQPPTPPPPPPIKTLRRLNGTRDISSPVGNTSLQKSGAMHNLAANLSHKPHISPNGIANDPHPRRKIVRIISGKKPEPLRQEDDVTPKLKRNQPVVDEAYSRRW